MFKHMADSLFSRAHSDTETDLHRERLRKVRKTKERSYATQTDVSRSLSLHHRLGNAIRLVAYTRYGGEQNTVEMQLQSIKKYCGEHGYIVTEVYNFDSSCPSAGLGKALAAMDYNDGMIVADLNRLVDHHDDPARDLAPLVQEQFFHNNKHLVSVYDVIDTSTTLGQNALLHHLRRLIRVA
jgi:hypothetical protein